MSAAVEDLPPRIRRMRQADVVAVAGLDRDTYQYPWSPGIFRDCLLAGYNSFVLESVGEVVGYGIISVAAGEAHLLNICVAKSLQGRGIGRQLLAYMMRHVREAGAKRVFLEVRPSNERAQRMYHNAGFNVIGMRRGYYRTRGGHEDAVVLAYQFTDKD